MYAGPNSKKFAVVGLCEGACDGYADTILNQPVELPCQAGPWKGAFGVGGGALTSGVASSLPPLSFPWVAGAIPSFCSWALGSAHLHDAGRRLPCLGVVASGPASVTITALLSLPSLGFLPPCLGVKRRCFFCDNDPIAWLGDFWGSVVGLVAAATLLLSNSRWDWILVGGPFLPKVRSTAVGAIVMVFACNCLAF